MTATLYHNPRCSKSRQALALLEEKKVSFSIREYLKDPLSVDELDALLTDLNIDAHELLRTKEADYKTAGLSKTSAKKDILQAMVSFPKLIERPILKTENGARIGRPTEQILEVL